MLLKGTGGDKEVIGEYGIGEMNAEGQMIVECKEDENGSGEYLF